MQLLRKREKQRLTNETKSFGVKATFFIYRTQPRFDPYLTLLAGGSGVTHRGKQEGESPGYKVYCQLKIVRDQLPQILNKLNKERGKF